MTLHQLCEELNISRRAVQGYEKMELVRATGRTKHGYLLYGPEAQDQIRRIRFYQEVGFTLREIKALWSLPASQQRVILLKKQRELQEKQARISDVLASLDELIATL